MSLSEYESDALAQLEEQIEVDDPDLAFQFLALEHPGLGPRRGLSRSSGTGSAWARWFMRASMAIVIVCLPGVLFGAWTLVSAIAVIGSLVVSLAAVGTLLAERGDHTQPQRARHAHPSKG
jgi:hypothetical protein